MSDLAAVFLFLCIVALCLMFPPLIVLLGMAIWVNGTRR